MMKLKYSFEIVTISDESIAVAVSEDAENFKGILQCNETAAAVLKLLKTDTTEERIIAGIRDEYDAPDGVIEAEVHSFINTLREKDLLV